MELFKKLPPEVRGLIFGYLHPEEVARLREVEKGFKELLDQDSSIQASLLNFKSKKYEKIIKCQVEEINNFQKVLKEFDAPVFETEKFDFDQMVEDCISDPFKALKIIFIIKNSLWLLRDKIEENFLNYARGYIPVQIFFSSRAAHSKEQISQLIAVAIINHGLVRYYLITDRQASQSVYNLLQTNDLNKISNDFPDFFENLKPGCREIAGCTQNDVYQFKSFLRQYQDQNYFTDNKDIRAKDLFEDAISSPSAAYKMIVTITNQDKRIFYKFCDEYRDQTKESTRKQRHTYAHEQVSSLIMTAILNHGAVRYYLAKGEKVREIITSYLTQEDIFKIQNPFPLLFSDNAKNVSGSSNGPSFGP